MSNHHIPSSIIYLHELDFVTIFTRDTCIHYGKGTSAPIGLYAFISHYTMYYRYLQYSSSAVLAVIKIFYLLLSICFHWDVIDLLKKCFFPSYRTMRMFRQTNVAEKNGKPLVTPDMDGRFYQTVTAVPAIVLEENPKSAEVKRSMYII